MDPKIAIERLLNGNKRYAEDNLEHPNRTSIRREAIVARQTPYAVILGCADSRVSPEIIFDEGVGDLFVVRVAGNILGPLELDSIEYAALYLHSSIILVMGHENCGAVYAVIHDQTKEIESILEHIAPSIEEAKKNQEKDLLTASIKRNAIRSRDLLLTSPVIQTLVRENKLEVH